MLIAIGSIFSISALNVSAAEMDTCNCYICDEDCKDCKENDEVCTNSNKSETYYFKKCIGVFAFIALYVVVLYAILCLDALK